MAEMLELVILRKLESPNKTRGYHWRSRHRETKVFEALLRCAIRHDLNAWSLILRTETRKDKLGQWRIFEERRQEKRRVTVIRQVKCRRQFIQDDDNLQFSAKPVNDALKRLGLVYEDKRKWMEQPPVLQEVSPDKIARTIIRIERISEEASSAA